MESDRIDAIRAHWTRERPELDSTGFAIVARLLVLARLLDREQARALGTLSLKPWAFDVLATLGRQGPPYRLTPSELSRATMLTSGAMTHRLDRLEAAGHIRREPDPDDRRVVRVCLTEEGLRQVARGIEVRFRASEEAVAGLSAPERAALEGLLRKLLLAAEGPG